MERDSIRAVTFDAGGTLLDPWPSVGHVYAEVAARLGRGKPSPEKLNEQFAAAWRTRREFDYSRPAWFELVHQTFAGLIEPPPDEEFFAVLYERFAEPSAWRSDISSVRSGASRKTCSISTVRFSARAAAMSASAARHLQNQSF